MKPWIAIAALVAPAVAGAADVPQMSSGYVFAQKEGKALYAASCQGCHMANGEGARGAGFYPKLAGNPLVQIPEYIVHRVANGYRGMPAFAGMMSDEQIAAVATYVRQSFDKPDAPAVTVGDVRRLRQP